MRQPNGSAHKKNDDLGNEEQDLDMFEFDGVLLQDRAMEEIKSGLMSEGGDFCFGCAFVCCASVGMIFFILYFDLPV